MEYTANQSIDSCSSVIVKAIPVILSGTNERERERDRNANSNNKYSNNVQQNNSIIIIY